MTVYMYGSAFLHAKRQLEYRQIESLGKWHTPT
jgi:hypothetical protein